MTSKEASSLLTLLFNTYGIEMSANYKGGVVKQAFEMAIELLRSDDGERFGKWEDFSFGLKNDCFTYTRCSKCHGIPSAISPSLDTTIIKKMTYCPNCGARMVEE